VFGVMTRKGGQRCFEGAAEAAEGVRLFLGDLVVERDHAR
jgi:hypothetical protein